MLSANKLKTEFVKFGLTYSEYIHINEISSRGDVIYMLCYSTCGRYNIRFIVYMKENKLRFTNNINYSGNLYMVVKSVKDVIWSCEFILRLLPKYKRYYNLNILVNV